MWISTKNNQIINLDKVCSISIAKGKSYYDDNAVLQTYYYICIDGKKVVKCINEEYALNEIENIKLYISQDKSIYQVDGVKMNEDENGNLID